MSYGFTEEWDDSLEGDIELISSEYGFDGVEIWKAVLSKPFLFDELESYLKTTLPNTMPEDTKSRFETILSLRYNFSRLSSCHDKEDFMVCFDSILYGVRSYYNFGYIPTESEMASHLRKGKRNKSTEFFEYLADHCLNTESVAQNVALTLVNPDSFESIQRQLLKGRIVYRANREKSVENKVIHCFDKYGDETFFKFRSIEGLVGRVVKRRRARSAK